MIVATTILALDIVYRRQNEKILKASFRDLEKFLIKMISGGEALRYESSRKLCKHIVNSGYDGVENDKTDSRVRRYSSISSSLMGHLQDDADTIWAEKKSTAFKVTFRCIGEMLRIQDLKTVYSLTTRCCSILIRKGIPLQTGHIEYSFQRGESPRYFILITGSEAPTLVMSEISHKF